MARLGDILVKHSWITEGQLQSALAAQGSERGLLGTILVRRGLIDNEQLGASLSEQYGVPFLEIVAEGISPQVVRLLPEELARQREVVPVSVTKNTLQLAMAAPDDMDAISEAELITGYRVDPVVTLQSGIHAALDRGFDDRVVARQTIVDMKMADLEAAEEAIEEELATDETREEDQAPPSARRRAPSRTASAMIS
ncbi:MAG: hypothetical protein IH831_03170 [Planctomycetes bacterium]|nr:hypothetical protein [Planctomycetota bacterium]